MNIERTLMPEREARACVERIRAGLDGIREAVLDLYERQGWRSLGYGSWRECVIAEFEVSKSALYRELEAARVDREISQLGKTESLPYTQARELARLKEPDAIREVWREVREATPEPTAKVIHAAVERRLNPPQEYVCTECGEVHATRECPNCAEPEPRPMTVAQVPTLPDPPQLTREQRAYHQVFQLLSLFSLDPVAVAQAAPSIDSARRLLNELIGAEAWASQFVRELERQSSGGLRAIR